MNGPSLTFAGRVYGCHHGEAVLDALLRQGVDLAYSCRKGTCLTCVMRCIEGSVGARAQEGLRDTHKASGCFLPCVGIPDGNLVLEPAEVPILYRPALVSSVERLAPAITRIRLEPAAPLHYYAGQFVNVRRADGLARSYSLASVPRLDRELEIHVKRLPDGRMSGWLSDQVRRGDRLGLQGPNGDCYYGPGKPDQPLLLIGNGSGLAPLLGIARDALAAGHRAEIRLYHGSRQPEGLYSRDELAHLALRHRTFRYVPCVSGPLPGTGNRPGRADTVAFEDLPRLVGWRVFLCGYPPMVHAARQAAYLAGAALSDILADPFELRELRRQPRN